MLIRRSCLGLALKRLTRTTERGSDWTAANLDGDSIVVYFAVYDRVFVGNPKVVPTPVIRPAIAGKGLYINYHYGPKLCSRVGVSRYGSLQSLAHDPMLQG